MVMSARHSAYVDNRDIRIHCLIFTNIYHYNLIATSQFSWYYREVNTIVFVDLTLRHAEWYCVLPGGSDATAKRDLLDLRAKFLRFGSCFAGLTRADRPWAITTLFGDILVPPCPRGFARAAVKTAFPGFIRRASPAVAPARYPLSISRR